MITTASKEEVCFICFKNSCLILAIINVYSFVFSLYSVARYTVTIRVLQYLIRNYHQNVSVKEGIQNLILI